jgi:ankyrin repeat protein
MSNDAGAAAFSNLLAIQDGQTSLFGASLNGHLQVVQFLVERGAKVETTNKVFFTSSLVLSRRL